MTQLEQAKQATQKLLQDPMDQEALTELRHALEAAQNGPPQGAADGSLTPPIWAEYTIVRNSLDNAQRAVRSLKQVGAL